MVRKPLHGVKMEKKPPAIERLHFRVFRQECRGQCTPWCTRWASMSTAAAAAPAMRAIVLFFMDQLVLVAAANLGHHRRLPLGKN
jgi:hypothetical protein